MPEMLFAAQSLDENTGGLLWQNWDAGMELVDKMQEAGGSHNTGEDNTPQQSSAV